MNEVGATPKQRKPFFFEGADGANAPVQSNSHSHGHGSDQH